jgi:tetratricopeptide (TPR) repeat protein
VAQRCRAVWDARPLLLRQQPKDDPERVAQQQADLLDLAILWADLHVRLAAPEEVDTARREALQVLAEAEAAFGPNPVLCRERQSLATKLRLTELARAAELEAARLVPRTAWEHYATGRQLLRSAATHGSSVTWIRDYYTTLALAQFEEAVRLRPQDFWPNFSQAACYYHLGRPREAVEAYRACIALAPNRVECYYNRGLAYLALNEADRALADLRRALDSGGSPAACHYQIARARLAQNDRTAAVTSLREALKHDANYQPAAALLAQLQAPRKD